MTLIWVSNTYDPERQDAWTQVARYPDETTSEAWDRYQDWLRGKVIGEPEAVGPDTVEQLKAMHLVGVYKEIP